MSDNKGQFLARFFSDFYRILVSNNVHTTTYHAQCNSFIRTILLAPTRYVLYHPPQWDRFIDVLTNEYNTPVHSTTDIAPFNLVLSRPPPHLSLTRTLNRGYYFHKIIPHDMVQSLTKPYGYRTELNEQNSVALQK